MATIKAIENRSVHQIQSGQVIVDLISVVKELVENSLDAGATSIEIRLKNQGLDSIEVIDNGKGIPPEDFETVALKHYTSKLSSYEDLTTLDTFGFRGEALSSLCALSRFHIITARAEDGAVGKRLEFETSGKLKSTAVVAAQKGTTVSVENLFNNLPVRRKELEKNIKREYSKVIAHLHAYACISVGVRFSVTNQMPKGKKVTVFSTQLNTTTRENIANVFGAKTLLALVKLDLHLEMQPSTGPPTQSARNWSTQATDRSKEVHVQGYISKPVFGEGRQAPDRQMFFVNSRPCGLPQVAKAVNEVYKSFNVSQVPFIFANLIIDTSAYDVNVSPDKRTIMLHDQTALLDSLKASLTELFERSDQTMPQTQLPDRKAPSYKPLTLPQRTLTDDEDESMESGSDGEDGVPPAQQPAAPSVKIPKPGSLIESWAGRDLESRETPASNQAVKTPMSKDKTILVRAMREKAATYAETNRHAVSDEADVLSSEDSIEAGASLEKPKATDANETLNQVAHGTDSLQLPQEADPVGSPYDDLFSQRPPQSLATSDQTVISTAKQSATDVNVVASESPDGKPTKVDQPGDEDSEPEPAITTITPSTQKATPGPVQNAFDRMRPKRTPLQMAEVTIGDKTTTTVIGSSPPYKRRRAHQPVNSQSITAFGGSPLLARGLRSFAAPGSQLALDNSVGPVPVPPSLQSTQEESDKEQETADDIEAQPGLLDEQVRDKAVDVVEQNPAVFDANGAHRQHLAKAQQRSDPPTSNPLDELRPAPADDDDFDDDYVDEEERKIKEDEKVARMIQEAEIAAAQPAEDNLRRASQVLKNSASRKDSTLQLAQYVKTTIGDIRALLPISGADSFGTNGSEKHANACNSLVKDEIDDAEAESHLSLTVSKQDFERMHVIGQFNLGFILAVRPKANDDDEDQLFIIDQHAADEKYNYERLQRTVTLQNQRLVRPKPLDLTAIEEEVILNNTDTLKANGFEIEIESNPDDEESQTGRRCRLLTLPISGEKTFDLSDLEELLHLLSEAPAGGSDIPRPKKVQKMLAMRACRSSIMVGKTLTAKQMGKVVRHMGEMEKPWNCPHGRPTMRHLAGLGAWSGWAEGDVIDEDEDGAGERVDWPRWVDDNR